MLASYETPDPFSVELTGAVLRQGNFIQKMVDLKWTQPSRFTNSSENETHILVRSVARYHAFLDLMSSSRAFFVPTLVSDTTWRSITRRTYRLAGYRTSTSAGTRTSSKLRHIETKRWLSSAVRLIMTIRSRKEPSQMVTISLPVPGRFFFSSTYLQPKSC